MFTDWPYRKVSKIKTKSSSNVQHTNQRIGQLKGDTHTHARQIKQAVLIVSDMRNRIAKQQAEL